MTAGSRFIPATRMHLQVTITKLAGQGYDFRDDQLSYTAAVTKGRVEDGDPSRQCSFLSHLIDADTEASNGQKTWCLFD
jgi:hypothetical protein